MRKKNIYRFFCFVPHCVFCITCSIVLWIPSAFASDEDGHRDPFEVVNRPVFEFNMFLDRAILKPGAKAYAILTPKAIRRPLETFISQFSYPVSALNYVLQGDFKNAGTSVLRFGLNFTLTMGMGEVELNDMAYTHQKTVQTLADADIGSGPYLVLPFAGHNMVRGHAGNTADTTVKSVFTKQILNTPTLLVVQTLINRAQIMDASDNFEVTSLDFYATTRSIIMQLSDSYDKKDSLDAFADFDFSEK